MGWQAGFLRDQPGRIGQQYLVAFVQFPRMPDPAQATGVPDRVPVRSVQVPLFVLVGGGVRPGQEVVGEVRRRDGKMRHCQSPGYRRAIETDQARASPVDVRHDGIGEVPELFRRASRIGRRELG